MRGGKQFGKGRMKEKHLVEEKNDDIDPKEREAHGCFSQTDLRIYEI